jgi:hypothetical protein
MNDSTQKASHATFVERRTFIRNAGAALSATVAASTAAAGSERTSDPDTQPAEEEIRRLHHTFVDRLNGRRYDELRELFAGSDTQPPRVAHFERHLPEGVLPPVHDYLVGHEQHLDTIEVAPDRRNATARFHCLTRMEAALSPSLPLIEMARQQGQGAIQWWEAGVLETSYVRSASGWQIGGLAFRPTGSYSELRNATNSSFWRPVSPI